MKHWIDVSRRLRDGFPVWPGDVGFSVKRRIEDGMTISSIETTCHVGTHMETGLHVLPDGPPLDAVPLSTLCGEAEVVATAPQRGEAIVPGDLPGGWRPATPRILFRTGTFPVGTPAIAPGFAGLSPELVERLAEAGVMLVGIDTPSVDPMEAEDLPAHRALAVRRMVWIEGLDLSGVQPGRYEMVALPLPLEGPEAAPARVVLRCVRLDS